MRHYKDLASGLEVFKVFGSETRVALLELIIRQPSATLNEIAKLLHISASTLSAHVQKLISSGLVTAEVLPGKHGQRKLLRIAPEFQSIMIDISLSERERHFHMDVPVGLYTSAQITPPCGLASTNGVICGIDDTRYFFHPKHVQASILWFTTGYVEYQLPNLIPEGSQIHEFRFQFEIGSEAPGSNCDWPSDICFFLNGTYLGQWTSPGDYGSPPGHFNPNWWPRCINQYGLVKTLIVNSTGTFLDEEFLSNINTKTFRLDWRSSLIFRFNVYADSVHPGGLTLYGHGFGNNGCSPHMTLTYTDDTTE